MMHAAAQGAGQAWQVSRVPAYASFVIAMEVD